MEVRKPLWVAVAAAAAVLLPLRAAHAGQKYTSTVVEDDTNPGTVHLKGCSPKKATSPITPVNCPTSNSVTIVPSTVQGNGGTTIQLKLKNVLCNGSPCNTTNNVFELWARALGTDTPGPSNPVIIAAAGLLFNITNGTAVFPNGKNVVAGGPAFGILVSAIFPKSLGVGLIKLHEPAHDPLACGFAPLYNIANPVLNNNHSGTDCINGNVFGVAGIGVPLDPKYLCTTDSDCPTITQTCQEVAPGQSTCQNEKCPGGTDAECRSGHCDINVGTCCDPTSGTCD